MLTVLRAFLAVLLFALPAQAQITFGTPNPSVNAIGQVMMCVNSANAAVACQGAAVTATFSGADTSSAVATLPAAAGATTYICGFTISGLGATSATNVIGTIASLTGGTASHEYSFPLGATVASSPVTVRFTPCIPASAVNTGIPVTVPGAAGNTSTNIVAWGFQSGGAVVIVAPTGQFLLMADGVNKVLQTNGVAKICLAGTC
jgi:hypothetical protein